MIKYELNISPEFTCGSISEFREENFGVWINGSAGLTKETYIDPGSDLTKDRSFVDDLKKNIIFRFLKCKGRLLLFFYIYIIFNF